MGFLAKISAAFISLLFFFLLFVYIQKDQEYFSSFFTSPTTISLTSSAANSDATQPSLSVIKLSEPAPSTITVLVGGDIMLDRANRLIGKRNGYDSLFAGISSLLHRADISIANLEGSITTYPSKTLMADEHLEDVLSFTFSTETAPALKRAGLTAVSLANNHSLNFGLLGIDQTHKWLESAGVEWFGDPLNIGPSASTTFNVMAPDPKSTADIICRKGICLAFVGYHEFAPGFEKVLNDVRRLSSAGYPVIVMPHWGDEYASIAPERIKEKARELASAGAFAIIGAHPHVTEDQEWIGDVPVIYSLGNLVFDQYFSPQVLTGNVAELTISAVPPESDGSLDLLAPPKDPHIDDVRLFAVSNSSHAGPVVEGAPVDFSRP